MNFQDHLNSNVFKSICLLVLALIFLFIGGV